MKLYEWVKKVLVEEHGIEWEVSYTLKILGLPIYTYKMDFYRDR